MPEKKAYQVRIARLAELEDDDVIVSAISHAQAKSRVILHARESGFHVEYTDKIYVSRRPEFDWYADEPNAGTPCYARYIREKKREDLMR